MYKSLILLSIMIIVSNVTAVAEKRYTQPTRSLSGNFSGHVRHLDAGLTKTHNKLRRAQAVTAATTPVAATTAATTPVAATIPIKPKATVSAKPVASTVSGPSPICAVSSFVGGKTTS